MTMEKPQAYTGFDPYIFISYSHEDASRVYPIIERLQQRGLRVWYDEGIHAGNEWRPELTKRIANSTCLIAFISKSFMASKYCKRELHFADEKKRNLMVFMLCVQIWKMMHKIS